MAEILEANLTRAEARARATRVGEVAYHLRLDLDAERETFGAHATVEFEAREGEGEVFLDFTCPDLRQLALDGQPLDLGCHDGVRLRLPEDRVPPGRHTLDAIYVSPYSKAGAGFPRFVDPADGGVYVYTNLEPYEAHKVLPCFDQPDLKARFDIEVRAPGDWEVISNQPTEAVEDLEGGRRKHRFRTTPTISTYLFNVTAGPFVAFDEEDPPPGGVPLRVLGRRSLAEHVEPAAGEVMAATRAGLDFYADFFGTPYPFEKYDQVFAPDFMTGAMENVGAVLIADSRYVHRHVPSRDERFERTMVVLHELAHMWFGNLVTMRWWDGLWLNESFATYMSFLALVEATEFTDAWTRFDGQIRHWALWQDQLPTTHPIETDVPETHGCFANFDGITYGKGCCVLRQLAERVGPEAFKAGVQAYFAKHAWSNTSNDDFLGALGEAAGVDLVPWAKRWLFSSGVNTLAVRLEAGDDGKVTRAVLEQEPGNGDGVLREHRLRVGIFHDHDGRLTLDRKLEVFAQAAAETVLEGLDGEPMPALVHPNVDGATYAKVALDEASVQTLHDGLEHLEDPALRAGFVDVLRQMVRDARLPARALVETAATALADEHDDAVREGLAVAALKNLDAFMPADQRAEAGADLLGLALARLEAEGADGAARGFWLRVLVGASYDDAALDHLAALLTEDACLPGEALGQKHRWEVLARVVRQRGAAAADLLAAEEARDSSHHGVGKALAIRAAMPDAEAKQAAWTRFLEDREASVELLKVGMAAFHQPGQDALLAPYSARYLEALPGVVAGRSVWFSAAWVQSMFPGYDQRPETAAAVREVLEGGELTAAVERTLREALDDLERRGRILARA